LPSSNASSRHSWVLYFEWIALWLGFLFQMLSKGFLQFFSSFLGCAIGIILPELKQRSRIGLGVPFETRLYNMVLSFCFLTTKKVSTTSIGHL